jgi:hypothetical protein
LDHLFVDMEFGWKGGVEPPHSKALRAEEGA